MPYLRTFTSGLFETNSFLIGAESSREAVLIDTPPDSYDKVNAALRKDGRTIAAIMITHPHFDHVVDVSKYASKDLPLVALAEAVGGIATPDDMGLLTKESGSLPGAEVTHVVSGADRLNFAGLEFEVFEVPGHCVGSAAFHVKSESLCFVGDLIFRGAIGRSDFPGGDFDVLIESIHRCIYTLSNKTMLLSGHGPSTDVGTEKRENPFTRVRHLSSQ
ncbi:MAG: hypothetical protein B6D68_00430 [spirochete symbiont of Stewartia floridana]|nr:MAG: hypothetical protein B6D68_00430 [spirochete symbiont of Stewartia floridana]